MRSWAMGTLPVPHEGKRPFFLKIDNRLEEVMLESLTEIKKSSKDTKWKIYKILYNEFKGANPNE